MCSMPAFKLISFKVGYLFLDIENKLQDFNKEDSDQNDNGYYYGLGMRFNLFSGLSWYVDGTGYYLTEERIHLVDGEVGLRVHF